MYAQTAAGQADLASSSAVAVQLLQSLFSFLDMEDDFSSDGAAAARSVIQVVVRTLSCRHPVEILAALRRASLGVNRNAHHSKQRLLVPRNAATAVSLGCALKRQAFLRSGQQQDADADAADGEEPAAEEEGVRAATHSYRGESTVAHCRAPVTQPHPSDAKQSTAPDTTASPAAHTTGPHPAAATGPTAGAAAGGRAGDVGDRGTAPPAGVFRGGLPNGNAPPGGGCVRRCKS